MSFDLPSELRQKLESLAALHGTSLLRARSAELTKAYGEGKASSVVDVAAYLTARLPATYASVSSVFHYVAELLPDFVPRSLLDVGAGPGTAALAARQFWPLLQNVELLERDPRFAAVAAQLVEGAQVTQIPLQNIASKADLVVAAYVMAELPEAEVASAALKLWAAAREMLVLVEPGTPQGFARIRLIRDTLIKTGAQITGPCTHANPCPMQAGDWCHFKVRLARGRAHMHAKGAVVPFEDEAYSWVAFTRHAVARPKARIIAPPKETKAGVSLQLCSGQGLTTETFASRDKATYKQARKLKWGDSLHA